MQSGLEVKERTLGGRGGWLIEMAGVAAAGAAAHQTCLVDHESTNSSMQSLVENKIDQRKGDEEGRG